MVMIMSKHLSLSGDEGFKLGQSATAELSKSPAPASECPRCGSWNTKFCYYNNYNKSQPRHFCKACKRHWTKGGTLRNIPAGRNKRPRAAPEPPHKHSRSLALTHDHHHKDMSDILYQALIRSSSSTILESNAPRPQIQNYTNTQELPLSSFSSLLTSPENIHSTEESAVPTTWNWNEVDFLANLWDHSDAEMITPYN